MASQALPQSPVLSYLVPAAAPPGKTTDVTLFGNKLAGAVTLWTSFPARSLLVSGDPDSEPAGKVVFRLSIPPEVQIGVGALRLVTSNGISSLQLLMIDDLPSTIKTGKNKTIGAAQELKLPIAVDGACDELNFDYYKFKAKKGERVSVEVVAQRLGSRLDPVLRLLDVNGRELVYCDDDPAIGPDARFRYKIPAAGEYWIELRDLSYQGGPQYRYRLRAGNFPLASAAYPPAARPENKTQFNILGRAVEQVKPATLTLPDNVARVSLGVKYPGGQGSGFVSILTSRLHEFLETEPNDATNQATPITLPGAVEGRFTKPKDRDYYQFEARKNERWVFEAQSRSLGSPCDLFMQLQKSDGSKLAEANATGANEGTITNTIPEDGTYRLMVEELNLGGGPELAYRIEIQPVQPGFALSVETEKVDAAQGGSFEIKVTSARSGYKGPITLALTNADAAFVLENNAIAKEKNETQLKVKLPDSLQSGQLVHFQIVGRAEVDGTDFTATASTMPALHKLFPLTRYPLPELDGLIGLGIRPGPPPAPSAKSEKAE
jgi:Bacterial pre-peptidase C-terminal domain